jgi:hypothetical protein
MTRRVGGFLVKIYNLTGYLIIVLYMLACMYFAPAHLGPWVGLLIGGVYFIFCWFSGGLYLADVLHLGIAHRSLDYKEWFIKAVTVVNNVFGLYVEPNRLGESPSIASQECGPSRGSQ